MAMASMARRNSVGACIRHADAPAGRLYRDLVAKRIAAGESLVEEIVSVMFLETVCSYIASWWRVQTSQSNIAVLAAVSA